ncbi:histidinol-phosphatase [Mycobacterium paraense]|uniref:Histidinol-phosphatase n=1 Tax=Mycobacterium paraense TaxID=767916 RepID=A0ABX3VGW9_9MYCO|nr:inositol monophosphatase family protein [Mycobacterium paraense]ORW28126.1 histidinol-phosphatase [Mycobacterium paraense]ORW42620.1 histidinol-phosphatase [Mycobacterium paraense]
MNNIADDVALALSLADEAESMTMPLFTAVDLYAKTRLEDTPLTDAYRDVDVALGRSLAMKRPEDTIFDETLRGPKMFAGRIWVIDPLDGRKNFIRGVPVWATLIALLVDGVPTVGVVSAPALHRRWWAAAGDGACTTRSTEPARRLSVSAIDDLQEASLCFSSLAGWGVLGLRERFIVLADDVWRARGYGDFYSYCLVAEGVADIALAAQVSVRQLAAVDILVREAGGTFTDLGGFPGPHGKTVAATNGPLHNAVLGRFSGTAAVRQTT